MVGKRSEEFIAFLQRKAPSPGCEICGHGEFGVPDDDEGLRANILISPYANEGVVLGPSIPALITFCKNCGNIRFHAKGVVDEDIARQKGEKNG